MVYRYNMSFFSVSQAKSDDSVTRETQTVLGQNVWKTFPISNVKIFTTQVYVSEECNGGKKG